jgi:hypothetical protein
MTVKPAIKNTPLLSRPTQESNRRKGPAALGLQHREEPRDFFLFPSPLSVLSQPLAVLCALPLYEAACVGVHASVRPFGLSSIVLKSSEHLNSPACKGDTMTMTAPKPVKLKLEETNTFLQVAPLHFGKPWALIIKTTMDVKGIRDVKDLCEHVDSLCMSFLIAYACVLKAVEAWAHNFAESMQFVSASWMYSMVASNSLRSTVIICELLTMLEL